MLSKMIFVLVIISTFIVLLANEDNTLDLGDSKLYFSINNTINSKYYINEYSRYTKTLKSYHHKKNEEIGNKIPPKFEKIDLPDFLAGENLRVKKGFQVIKIDSTLSTPFVINKFELDFWCGNDRLVIDFNNPDILDKNKQNLFIMAENEKILKEINPFSPEICKNSEINHRITELIGNYFYENRDDLKKQLINEDQIVASLDDIQFHNEISTKFDLLNFRTNDSCYFVIGSSKENDYHKFIALVQPDKEYVNLKVHTSLNNSFMIRNELYFYCKRSKPNTGWQIFYVYKIESDKLVEVFGDSSFSM